MSLMGPGCVKTPNFNLRVEISSRFLRFENQKCWQPLSGEDNRENNSAHSWLMHVFTQPRSKADKPSRAKIDLCPLWSNSGQTQRRLDCPLSAISRLMHCSKQPLYSITLSARASTRWRNDGASITAALWSGTIPIGCDATHVQDNALRVASCTLRPFGNSI